MCGAREWEGGGRKAEEWSREKVERGDNHNHMAVSRRHQTNCCAMSVRQAWRVQKEGVDGERQMVGDTEIAEANQGSAI